MSDLAGSPRRHNRANWIALRTLHQRPKVVGETPAGEPIFEVRAVRLVLPADSHHFSRLVACSKCGREVPGPAVLTPADFNHAPHQVICKDCVRAATAPMFDTAKALTVARGPRVSDPPAPNGLGNGHAVDRRPADDGRLTALEERINELKAALDRQTQQMQAQLAAVDANVRQLARAKEAADSAIERDAALERRVQNAHDQLSALTSSLQQLAGGQERLDARHDELRAALADVSSEREHDVGAVEETRRRADDAAERLKRLQAALDAAMVRSWSDSTTVEQAREDVTRIEVQLNERLDRRSERAARRAASDALRLQTLEAQVQAAVDALTATVDEQRLRVEPLLREGLDGLRTALAATVTRSARQFEELQEQAGRQNDELSALGDVQAALDGGLGELRSEIANLREVTRGLAARVADVERLAVAPPMVRPPPSPPPPARLGLGRRSAEVTARVAAVSATTDDLLRERQQLKAQLADLGRAADQATAASARASARASEMAPLRSDVKALSDEVRAQQDALESLKRSVERLRRKMAAPAAEPRRTPKPGKGRLSPSPPQDR